MPQLASRFAIFLHPACPGLWGSAFGLTPGDALTLVKTEEIGRNKS